MQQPYLFSSHRCVALDNSDVFWRVSRLGELVFDNKHLLRWRLQTALKTLQLCLLVVDVLGNRQRLLALSELSREDDLQKV